jgi:UDP-N-acetylglucosamine 2-epimerase
MRFDVLSSYPNFKDKIAVWSNSQKKYLTEQHQIDPNRILVTGSPRHDVFFKKKVARNIRKQKTILIAPNPTNEVEGQADTNLHIKVEKIIKDIHSIVKKIPDVNVIVKLHPIQLRHNDDLKLLFQEIDPAIPIYLWTSVIDVINSCDVVLVISPEGFATSTMILESLILEKPTINIVVDDKLYDFEHVKEKAVLTISGENDLQESLQAVLFGEELREQLVKNGRKFVDSFLANGGNASEYLARTLCSIHGDLNRRQNSENTN